MDIKSQILTTSDIDNVINNTNFPGLLLLGVAGIPALFFLVRWMIRFQKEFADIYVKENQKLRERIEGLEQEHHDKDVTIIELKIKVGNLENTIADHTRTIAHLNKIIERRKLDDG